MVPASRSQVPASLVRISTELKLAEGPSPGASQPRHAGRRLRPARPGVFDPRVAPGGGCLVAPQRSPRQVRALRCHTRLVRSLQRLLWRMAGTLRTPQFASGRVGRPQRRKLQPFHVARTGIATSGVSSRRLLPRQRMLWAVPLNVASTLVLIPYRFVLQRLASGITDLSQR